MLAYSDALLTSSGTESHIRWPYLCSQPRRRFFLSWSVLDALPLDG
jgi:hypothetical protein